MAVRAVAVLLTLLGLYMLAVGYRLGSIYFALLGIVGAGGGVGLFLKRAWSQYVLYGFALLTVISWLEGTWRAVESGRWASRTVGESALSLSPGLLLIGLCGAACVVVFKYFRRRPTA